MTSVPLTALLVTVGLAFLAQSIISFLLFRRVRALATRVAPATSPTATDESLRALEARLARLEASGGITGRVASAAGEPRRPRRLDRRQVAAADGPVLIAVPSLALAPASRDEEARAELDRRFGGIWALADGGLVPDEIARQAGLPVGQVELILGLRGLQVESDPTRDGTDG